MKKVLLICSVCFCAFTSIALTNDEKQPANTVNAKSNLTLLSSNNAVVRIIDSVYDRLNLSAVGLGHEAFQQAYKGYQYLLSQGRLKKADLLTIIDYSQSSANKRFYVIDLVNAQILYNLHVAHGKNSGEDYATSFSNSAESKKSSLGFLITGETYNGSKGFSLRLDGVERGINDNVRERAVVMHGSAYVNDQRAFNGTMMGRSFGCPALSYLVSSQVINTIKDGSCMFLYYPDRTYTQRSSVLNAEFEWPDNNNLNATMAKTVSPEKNFPSLLN
ncbi:MAG: hypothetical protein JWN76_1722 [Chitinophagaceae bacterium]|nr:hypothetical protein [Chitinophagaceae bacterium]